MRWWLRSTCLSSPAVASNAPLPTRTFADIRNGRHLVVDDSSYNRLVLRRYLNDIGVHVDEVEDAEGALRAVETHGTYAIVWLDLRLASAMNGAECCEVLRKDYGYAGVVIALTGYVDDETRDLCLNRAKMNDFLGKPFSRDKVRSYTLLHARGCSSEQRVKARPMGGVEDPVTTFYAEPAAHHALMAACAIET